MNQAFLRLPPERRQRIIDGAMAVFAQQSYKRASTDDMAARAGISKGLLFYYFHNKRALYLYLFEYATELMERFMREQAVPMCTDFFALMEQGARVKLALIEQSPHLLDFCMRAYFDKESEAADAVTQMITEKFGDMIPTYFSRVDTAKFRKDIDLKVLLQMLTWMAEGYLYEKQKKNLPLCTEEIMADFRTWSDYFKRMAYKPEFLAEGGKGECV